MIRNKSIKKTYFAMILCVWLGISIVHSQDNIKAEEVSDPVKAGLHLVEVFYDFLTSDESLENSPDIFSGSLSKIGSDKKRRKEALQFEWTFLRNNKRLFFSDAFLKSPFNKPSEFLTKTVKGYFFVNPPDIERLKEGRVYIVVLCTTGEPDGILKQIAFPILFDRDEKNWTIFLHGISINGVMIDIKYESGKSQFDRNFDWFERMGFR